MQTLETAYRDLILSTLRLRCGLGKITEKFELTPVQGMVLIMLEPKHNMTMNQLSCRLGCDASNTTGLVERLVARKLLKRSKDPHDKRVTIVALSGEGEIIRTKLLAAIAHADPLQLNS